MDDELREQCHSVLDVDDEEEWLWYYLAAHDAVFGTELVIN